MKNYIAARGQTAAEIAGIFGVRKTYRLLGADRLTFKTAQFYDYQYGNPLMPARDRDRRYEQCADGTYRLKRHPLRRLWHALTGISLHGSLLLM